MYDISTNPLCCYWSIVFPAIQFALWTNAKRIYIVGCDCNQNGYFDNKIQQFPILNGNKLDFNYQGVITGWKKLKEFKYMYYTETEIISVNPVGLKGLFKDVYTKNYLTEHDIKDFSNYSILES